MADITLCQPSKWCPLKHRCRRYMEEPDARWQSYADFTLGRSMGDACMEYWPWEGRDGKHGAGTY